MGLVTGQASDLLTVSRATSGTCFNSAGLLESVAAGLMRFDHDPVTKERLGVLVEGQRTNLFTRSDDLTISPWMPIRATVMGDAALAPDGTISADKIVEDATAGNNHQLARALTGYSTYGTVTFSVHLKQAERRYAVVRLVGSANSSAAFYDAVADLQTGQITATGGSPAAFGIEPAGNGFWRVWVAGAHSSGSQISGVVFLSNTASWASNPGYNGNGASGIYAWGAQLEVGPMPSSYIPTGASQVTRGADVITLARSAIPYDDTQVSIMVEVNWDYGSELMIAGRPAVQIDDGSNAERLLIYNSSGPRGSLYVGAGGATQALLLGDTANASFVKMAARAGTNTAQRAGNGVLGTEDTSVVMPAAPTFIRFGADSSAASNLFGHIKRVVIVPRLWSDAELIARSTP